MARIMSEEEFKESMKSVIPVEAPAEEKKPRIRRKTTKKPTKKTAKKKAPVAAEQKAEALTAASQLTKTFAEWLIKEAKNHIEVAEKYIDYTEILEGMK